MNGVSPRMNRPIPTVNGLRATRGVMWTILVMSVFLVADPFIWPRQFHNDVPTGAVGIFLFFFTAYHLWKEYRGNKT